MRILEPKRRVMVVTSPDEIASIKANGLRDIFGGCIDETYWAYSFSVKRWREGRRA